MDTKTPDAFAPPSSPMLNMPVTSHAQSVRDTLAAEGRPEPDDIPEPSMPDAVDMFMASAIASSVAQMPPEASRAAQEGTNTPPTSGGTPHEALLPLVDGFLGYLRGKLDDERLASFKAANTAIDDLCAYIKGWVEGVLNKKVLDQQTARLDGYGVTIQAMSPNGYPFTMTITKATKEEARAELIDTAIWLAENGCKMVS